MAYKLMPWVAKYKVYKALVAKPAYFGATAIVAMGAFTYSMFSIATLRIHLLENNLYDATSTAKYAQLNKDIAGRDQGRGCLDYLTRRTADGSCNNLDNPAMGMAGIRFGRNVDPSETFKETPQTLLSPNPREISRRLLTRTKFKPATIVNFAAASWLQFMTHDWFNHGDNQGPKSKDQAMTPDQILAQIPLTHDDPLRNLLIDKITVMKTAADPNDGNAAVETINHRGQRVTMLKKGYKNVVTHWWDGSQLYGSDEATLAKVRGLRGLRGPGEVTLVNNTMPTDASGMPVTGFNENWWIGLQMMHQLFLLEHNTIARTLARAYPQNSPDVQGHLQREYSSLNNDDAYDTWLFDKARLVNTAQIAKIHAVEWTPAILKNQTLDGAMTANWAGLVQALKKYGKLRNPNLTQAEREQIFIEATKITPYDKRKFLGRNHLQDQQKSILSKAMVEAYNLNNKMGIEHDESPGLDGVVKDLGLIGTRTSLYGVPFTLTEEFVSVYRMHSLLRDKIDIFDHNTGRETEALKLGDVRNQDAVKIAARISPTDLWYSFGVTHPGALTLNNYPSTLQNLTVPYRRFPFIQPIDMATVDILRDRERGVPRYNRFRQLLGMPRVEKFEDFGLDTAATENLRQVYGNDIEKVDLLIGCLSESVRPEGYGFGETAFQVFALMASRRLMADRFFAEGYTEDVYTKVGLDWVDNTSMKRVLLRHFPELKTALDGAEDGNAFRPWKGEINEN